MQFHGVVGRTAAEISSTHQDGFEERNNCIRKCSEELYDITSKSVRLIDDCVKKYAKDDHMADKLKSAIE